MFLPLEAGKGATVDGPVVVTGGTGVLGRRVVDNLLAAGHEVRVVSRRPAPRSADQRPAWATADLVTGEGVEAALDGAAAIVHCATSGSAGKEVRATGAVVDAARRGGCRHLIYVSIVGVDRIPLRYYRGKLAAERLVGESGVPHTILRATQFHDLVRLLCAGAARLPVMLLPGMRFQPVDVRDVATRLVELVTGEPRGRASDMGGPEVRPVADLARAFLDATGQRRAIVPVRLPGRTFGAFRAGHNLAPDGRRGTTTFEQYLAGHPDPASLSYRGGRR